LLVLEYSIFNYAYNFFFQGSFVKIELLKENVNSIINLHEIRLVSFNTYKLVSGSYFCSYLSNSSSIFVYVTVNTVLGQS